MSEATIGKKKENVDPDIYRVDTFVRVVNHAKLEHEFNGTFGKIIRKVKRFFNFVVNILTVFFSLIGLGTVIWFIATVLM